MCDPDLEYVLNMKDLHVTEVQNQILKQLTLVKQQNWGKNFNTYRKENTFHPELPHPLLLVQTRKPNTL